MFIFNYYSSFAGNIFVFKMHQIKNTNFAKIYIKENLSIKNFKPNLTYFTDSLLNI